MSTQMQLAHPRYIDLTHPSNPPTREVRAHYARRNLTRSGVGGWGQAVGWLISTIRWTVFRLRAVAATPRVRSNTSSVSLERPEPWG